VGGDMKIELKHPAEAELADFLSGGLSAADRERLERHISSCPDCLNSIVSSYEAVEIFRRKTRSKPGKDNIMKKINIYLVLALLSFALSFAFQQHFLQLLVATLILGIKWVVDSKTTKMLIMIQEAWKAGGEKETSRLLQSLNSRKNSVLK
jgi:hypothetical protein